MHGSNQRGLTRENLSEDRLPRGDKQETEGRRGLQKNEMRIKRRRGRNQNAKVVFLKECLSISVQICKRNILKRGGERT